MTKIEPGTEIFPNSHMGPCFDNPKKHEPFASKNDIFEHLDVTN